MNRVTSLLRRSLAGAATALALGAATTAQALPVIGTFTPGHLGSLDNAQAVLLSAHPGETTALFSDLFTFTVSSAAGVLGATFSLTDIDPSLPLTDAAIIVGIALLDELGAVVASDLDGSDGFSIVTILPSAGGYGLAVSGYGGTGAGLYGGLLAAQLLAVSEPPAVALALAALLLALRTSGTRRALRPTGA